MQKYSENKIKNFAIQVRNTAPDGKGRIYLDTNTFSMKTLNSCKTRFEKLCSEGCLRGHFEDNTWFLYNEISYNSISFQLEQDLYEQHGKPYMHLSYYKIILAMKCYAVLLIHKIIAPTISYKIYIIRKALENIGTNYSLTNEDRNIIEQFVFFCGLTGSESKTVKEMFKPLLIKDEEADSSKPRSLAHILTYLVLDNEMTSFYIDASEEEKIKFFPVYFWNKATYVIPVRGTETTLTPFNCLSERDGKTILSIVRTKLKKRDKTVEYRVSEDYKIFYYPIPNDHELVHNIHWYQEKTRHIPRPFLMVPNHINTTDPLFRLRHLNELIEEFMEKNVRHNRKYDYAKSMAGIQEFEHITAGDARHIAMSNIYYSGFSLEICRALADQEDIDISKHYALNVQNTLQSSAIMRIQRQINDGLIKNNYKISGSINKPMCLSKKRQLDPENTEDCDAFGHLSNCIGCELYIPTNEIIEEEYEKKKKDIQQQADNLRQTLLLSAKMKNRGEDLEQAFLMAQTAAARFCQVIDIMYQKGATLWQDQEIIKTTNS